MIKTAQKFFYVDEVEHFGFDFSNPRRNPTKYDEAGFLE